MKRSVRDFSFETLDSLGFNISKVNTKFIVDCIQRVYKSGGDISVTEMYEDVGFMNNVSNTVVRFYVTKSINECIAENGIEKINEIAKTQRSDLTVKNADFIWGMYGLFMKEVLEG